ncbi:hypothetical protein Y032_0030g2207 [Ancylostoma ceylanicum]|uniref:SCP domain-containing protein n=1 Tax=Ancylostoma ceylanicum TaxID=53326 RepID=A0A016UQJ4_9BILA|nr:hypothetical protein Y032_0030g2207 [Ancylostoma ceylanicum]
MKRSFNPDGVCKGPVTVCSTELTCEAVDLIDLACQNSLQAWWAASTPTDRSAQKWSSELEQKAIDAVKGKYSAPNPPDITPLLHQENEDDSDPLDFWLSEIKQTEIELHKNPEAPVKYAGKNTNYCSLVRYDASHIGCAETKCNGKKTTFCLTDQPPLQDGDVVYYWGKGACPTGKCRPPSYGCSNATGLCYIPVN